MSRDIIIGGGEAVMYQELIADDGDDVLIVGPYEDHDDKPSDWYLPNITRAWGGDGDDTYVGAVGIDEFHGGPGYDMAQLGRGPDTFDGGLDPDVARGGGGDDTLSGGRGNDTLRGDKGDDTLHGNQDEDYLSGGPGADVLHGGSGADTLTGGAGADTFIASDGNDIITDWGEGDALDLDGRELVAVVEGAGSTVVEFDGGSLTLVGVTDLPAEAIVA